MFDNPFSMVVAIVAIVMIASVFKARYSVRHIQRRDLMQHPLLNPQNSAETSALKDEVKALKERIAVLERVVTDNHGAMRLEEEIERLRGS